MNSFKHIFNTYDWDEVYDSIYNKTSTDVEIAFGKSKRDLEDFKSLVSPAGMAFIEPMAQESHERTRKRFGHTMQMYAPMYLSNECQNICTYCGFSLTNDIPRKTLSDAEIIQEAEFLLNKGYKHILLVTGEANKIVGVDYLEHVIQLLRPYFTNISIEVQPLSEEEYRRLKQVGLYATLVYQETYHRVTYKIHHPKGKKSNFDFRLETPDRIGSAGLHKIGIGALLGLEDWRTDSFFTALHLKYLQKKYWKTKYAISFPRLRPFSGGLEPKLAMTDADLVQLISAYRLLDEDIELSISTRESAKFRDHIIQLGVTSMSAESKTNPGGYSVENESLEQFEISDERTTAEITALLKQQKIEPVWKDWEKAW
ncbi:2-iminoacetate synthase ThiH [Flavobacteriaceae bacterium Ap0902]|nr:2-iminoacetate synthase ThiH [Flavobacteriaceae bacterium Ap0902]